MKYDFVQIFHALSAIFEVKNTLVSLTDVYLTIDKDTYIFKIFRFRKGPLRFQLYGKTEIKQVERGKFKFRLSWDI